MTWSASEPAVRVLGSVSVEVDGRLVPVGGPLPRRLLAVLLANRDAVLSVDRLVEVLWGDEPPEAATSSLQTYVSRLRRLLPPSVRVETAAPGYRLRLEPGAVDVERFEAALGGALACLADRPDTALAGLEEALGCWRGDAFAEFAGEWWAQGEAARLEELRLLAREGHAEALLGVGRSEAAVSEARAVTVEHPGRERAWRTLVVGLHRGGRQRDAFHAAGEYRARLRDESGLDPSKDFAALEARVAAEASSDPTLLGNVTPPISSLVGRQDELTQLLGEVSQRRLVTLTGVGGVGKTRLAAEIAWSLVDEFPSGVWAVELAPVASPDAVAHAVAGTLSIRSQEGMSVAESVADTLRGRRSLLVLDNCEHVLDAVGELVVLVMTSCPTVTLLATSREPIGVPGEHVWAVPPLPPAAGGVELFCDRAAAADAAFTPSEADLAAIAAVCERLDGLPLAIELAAARVRSMTLVDLTEALHDRFRLLRSGRRIGPERHRTLQATVRWSYQLLSDDERLLFDRLAVFAGGFDVAAVEAVCSDDGIDHSDVGDLLGALVDKSMVVADRRGVHARYALLETLRQYGSEGLDERHETGALRDRHLAYFAGLAGRADRQARGAGYFDGVRVLEVEWDNLRAALDRAVGSSDATSGSELVERLLLFAVWQQRHELGEWAQRVTELDEAGPAAFAVAAMFATLRGDQQRALELTGRGMAAATVATRSGERLCVEMTGRALWFSGQLAESWATMQRWDSMFDAAEEPFEAAWAAVTVSSFAVVADPSSAARFVERARQIAPPLRNAALETHIVWATGLVETNAGRYEAARDLFRQALESAVRTGDLYFEGWATRSIALLAADTNAADAGSALRHALTHLYTTRNWMNVWGLVEALSLYWWGSDRMEPAGVLLGHLEAHDHRHAGGGGRSGPFVERRRLVIAALLELPGGEAWMAHGAHLDRDELVTYAIDQLVSSDDA